VQLTGSVGFHLDGRVGQAIDFDNARPGHVLRVHPQANLDLGRHLRLELSHNHEQLDVLGGQRLYRADLSELRATYQLSVRSFVRVITQYLDVVRDPALYAQSVGPETRTLFDQLLFSYKVNPQTVLFLGYSDDLLGGDGADPLQRVDRTVFVKVGYALVL